ncbi:hypothetical protein O3P69_003888 [Scylla paramamosain]|uniref:Uncharacterized protein n=1 Tax=Scylla paramamosain TaxID=85552 RepID=A0AAW0UDS4_SCYPA
MPPFHHHINTETSDCSKHHHSHHSFPITTTKEIEASTTFINTTITLLSQQCLRRYCHPSYAGRHHNHEPAEGLVLLERYPANTCYVWLAALLLTMVAPGGGDQPTTAHYYTQPAVKVEHPHARLTTAVDVESGLSSRVPKHVIPQPHITRASFRWTVLRLLVRSLALPPVLLAMLWTLLDHFGAFRLLPPSFLEQFRQYPVALLAPVSCAALFSSAVSVSVSVGVSPELIKVHGYPVEVHEVITDDGFIIEIHRIPHGRRHPTATHSHTYRSHIPHALYRPSLHVSQGYLNAGRAQSHLSNHVDEGVTRVTNGSHDAYRWSRSRDPKVVLLFPGVFSSSADFVLNEPDQALGFILADGGYDVWLGNYRGNFYARRHTHLTTSDPEFWDHTWNELARYDLPAMLRHVRAVSGAQRVSYIGFSLGTSVFFAMFSYHPEISSWVPAKPPNTSSSSLKHSSLINFSFTPRISAPFAALLPKVRSMVALAPVAYIYHMPVPLGLISPFAGLIERVLERADLLELFPLMPERSAPLKAALCGPTSLTQPLCILNIHFQNGFNQVYLDKEYLPVLLAHYPAGAGYKVFMHLLQLHASRKFRAYDYGPERNYREYGQTSPPDFSLAKVQVPVALFWSENDALASPLVRFGKVSVGAGGVSDYCLTLTLKKPYKVTLTASLPPYLPSLRIFGANINQPTFLSFSPSQDVAQTASELPQVALNRRINLDYNHLDFMWAEDAGERVYRPALAFLDAFY